MPLPNLAGTPWLAAAPLARIVAALEAGGGAARIVGGAVRNALMGRPVTEVDIATTVVPQDVLRLATEAGLKAVATGLDHGTVTIVADHAAYEVTTLRRDVETFGRRAVVAFTTEWREDAMRRDFTMNALYATLDGTLCDPVDGYPDIEARHVRFIGDARTRIREDFLRILRLFRFHAEFGHGAIDPEGLAAAAELKDGLAGLSRERIRQELVRLLAARGASEVVATMHRTGILAAIGLGAADPERLERLVRIETRTGAVGGWVLRLAALALDPARGAGADALTERLRLANDERDGLADLADAPAVTPSLTSAERRELVYRAGVERTRLRALFAFADAEAAPDDAAWTALLADLGRIAPPAFPVAGRDLVALGIPAGPAIGGLLERLESRWIAEGFVPARQELLELARTLSVGPASGREEK